VLFVNKEFLQMYICIFERYFKESMYIPKWGSIFFFTFRTSEGSDLLSSHVMQTPTFISKVSDENVIFRLDVGKMLFPRRFPEKFNTKHVNKISYLTRSFKILGTKCLVFQFSSSSVM
jgi:hypothetical protein